MPRLPLSDQRMDEIEAEVRVNMAEQERAAKGWHCSTCGKRHQERYPVPTECEDCWQAYS